MPHPGRESVRTTSRRRTRLALASLATAAAVTIFGIAGAQAFNAAQAQHFAECFGWMLTDPDVHAQNCLPGHLPGPGSLSEKGEPPAPEPEPDYSYRNDT